MICVASSLLAQAADPLGGWGALGVGGVLAGLMFHFYRKQEAANNARWEDRAGDFKTIIQENTAAITSLRDALQQGRCPLAGSQPAAVVTVQRPEISQSAGGH